MIVQDIMTTNIKTVFLDQPAKDIALMMTMDHISGQMQIIIQLVLFLKRIFCSICFQILRGLSDTHFDFENMVTNYKDTMSVKISEIMTEGVDSIDVDIPCLKAASTMWLRKYRRFPVTQQGKLIGIISIGDVHRAIFKSCMTSQVKITCL